jgi:group II intron reverse transcriptase/maturase
MISNTTHQKPGQLGRPTVGSGEAARGSGSDEVGLPRNEPSRPRNGDLLRQALERENLVLAWKRVKRNKGSAGVDGLSVQDTADMLKTRWPAIREALLGGSYRPQPVRKVEIPKPGGGVRELGIPTVTDRLIQQALLQILQPLIDPTFSEHSYGFRPGRSAHDAIRAARRYVQDGHRVVVDVDLSKFFDRVNHDILIDRLKKRIDDAEVIALIRRYLNAGIMANGVEMDRHEGTPQGGPISPLLANILLDDVDRLLERRGHLFARYADDCNVYVRSRKAGERVMAGLRKAYAALRLQINEEKSAVASAFQRKFLGYSLYAAKDGVRFKVAVKALHAYKQRIREITGRNKGQSLPQVAERLRQYMPGWKAYFSLAQTPGVFQSLDEWLRHRLRMVQLKHWKRGPTIYRELRKLGASEGRARRVAANSRRWCRNSWKELNRLLPIAYFDGLGVPRLSYS